MNAWDKFRKTVVKDKLVNEGDKILISVSGGPDSICLMHLLWRLRKTLYLDLHMVYFDHGLRKQSSKEIKLIEKYSKTLNIPFISKKILVREFSYTQKISLETAGRGLRYKTLNTVAAEAGCNKIATGHNANDNAETVIMWLLRGTGTDGLAGIPLCRNGGGNIKIIRPILSVTRSEIIEYLKSQKLSYCIDKSNDSLEFTRNKIRHCILPVMQKHSVQLVEHLYNLSRGVSLEKEYFRDFVASVIKTSVKTSKNQITLDLKRFFGYNDVIQKRVLKEIMPEKISSVQIERLIEWISLPSSKIMVFSRSWNVEKNQKKLVFKNK